MVAHCLKGDPCLPTYLAEILFWIPHLPYLQDLLLTAGLDLPCGSTLCNRRHLNSYLVLLLPHICSPSAKSRGGWYLQHITYPSSLLGLSFPVLTDHWPQCSTGFTFCCPISSIFMLPRPFWLGWVPSACLLLPLPGPCTHCPGVALTCQV